MTPNNLISSEEFTQTAGFVHRTTTNFLSFRGKFRRYDFLACEMTTTNLPYKENVVRFLRHVTVIGVDNT